MIFFNDNILKEMFHLTNYKHDVQHQVLLGNKIALKQILPFLVLEHENMYIC